jgi:hypothetical protein
MSEAFEALVIEDLKTLKQGNSDLLQAFSDHKDEVNRKFADLEVKAAEEAGAAKVRASLWGAATGFLGTVIAGSWEYFRHR